MRYAKAKNRGEITTMNKLDDYILIKRPMLWCSAIGLKTTNKVSRIPMNALSESNIAADMTLPAREIPGSGSENMHNMLEMQNHKSLKQASYKCYTEHMY